MLIRVNPKVGIWGYFSKENPNYRLWITLADPKPQEINVQGLPGDLAKAVEVALRTKVLLEVKETGEKVKEASQVAPGAQEVKQTIKEDNPALKIKAKELLKSGVASIRREVALIEDPMLLSIAISIERKGKARKTVKEILEKKLEKCPSLSSSKVLASTTRARCPSSIYDHLIEEEEEEQVVFEKSNLVVKSEIEKGDEKDES